MIAPIKFNCVQINLQRNKSAPAALTRRFNTYNHKVALIQEPYTIKTNKNHNSTSYKICGLSGGNLIYCNTERPRAALMIDIGVNYMPLSEFVTRDLVAAIVTLQSADAQIKQVFCSSYHAGDDSAVPYLFQKLVDYCRKEGFELIYACDANAHNTFWGSKDTDSRGTELLDFIFQKNLDLLNKGNVPTLFTLRNTTNGQTPVHDVIDLTLASNFISQRIIDWKVSLDASCSDHRYLEFALESVKAETRNFRNPKLTDWEKYENLLADRIGRLDLNINTIRQLDRQVDKFSAIIKECYFESNKEKSVTTNKDNQWWNKNLTEFRKKVNKVFSKSKTSNNWDEYHKILSEYKSEILQAKFKSWKKTVEDLKDVPATAKIHKIISKSHKNKLGTLLKGDNTYTRTEKETLDELSSAHFPGKTTQKPNKQYVNYENLNANDSEKIFTIEAIKWAIESFNPFKSGGVDEIFPALLQKALNLIIPVLKIFYIKSHLWGYVPMLWRKVKVVFIPKAGKRSSFEAKSFRPISLSSFCLKTMERIIDRHIKDNVLIENPLHENQFAYQEGKSTDAALKKLFNQVKKNYRNYSLAAFIDISGAFDNTSHDSICNALERKGVDRKTITWINSMLRERQAITTLGSSMQKFYVTRGCPQGGVLSPLLWCLVIDDLITKLNLSGVYVQAYADDVVIISNSICPVVARELLEKALKFVITWCDNNGLTVNPEKAEIVMFTTRRGKRTHGADQPANSYKIKFGDKIIEAKNEVKYLGVIFDKTLNWNAHVKHIAEKARIALFTCKQIIGKQWGLRPSMAHWIYTGIVRPILAYAAFSWWEKTLEVTTQKILSKLQHQACLMILNCSRSTPTASMEILLDLPPLHIFLQYEALNTNYRFKFSEIPVIQKLSDEKLELDTTRYKALQYPMVDKCLTKFNLRKHYKINIPQRQDWSDNKIRTEVGAEVWYTDGSKHPDTGSSGCGLYHENMNRRIAIRMGKEMSVFQTEVMAINDCTYKNLSNNVTNRTIYIFSDSQAALKALGKTEINSKLVYETSNNLNKLASFNKVILSWIPGHSGFHGNEIADKLAGLGAKYDFVGPEPFTGIPWSSVKASLKQWMQDAVENFWDNRPGLVHSKAFIGRSNKNRSKKILELKRSEVRLITGFYTGHFPVRHYLRNINIATDDACRFCGLEAETVEHLLCDCEVLARRRLHLLGSGILEPQFFNNVRLSKLLKYIKALKI